MSLGAKDLDETCIYLICEAEIMEYFCDVCNATITEREFDYSTKVFGKALCRDHQDFERNKKYVCTECDKNITFGEFKFSKDFFQKPLCIHCQDSAWNKGKIYNKKIKEMQIERKKRINELFSTCVRCGKKITEKNPKKPYCYNCNMEIDRLKPNNQFRDFYRIKGFDYDHYD